MVVRELDSGLDEDGGCEDGGYEGDSVGGNMGWVGGWALG